LILYVFFNQDLTVTHSVDTLRWAAKLFLEGTSKYLHLRTSHLLPLFSSGIISRDGHGSDGGADKLTSKAALPDLVESFVFKPEEATKPKPPTLEKVGLAYHNEMLRVLNCLHHLTAASLGLSPDFFDPFYAPHAEVSLRLAFYPPIPEEAKKKSAAVRYGEHTDYTGYTCKGERDKKMTD
jgi:hypothetical protein